MLKILFGNKQQERRYANRKKTHNLVLLSVPHEEKLSNLIDLSEYGAQFSFAHTLPHNRKVNLKINLAEHGCEVKVTGRVVWSKRMPGSGCLYRIGVSFMEVSQEAWTSLQHYLAHRKAA